MSAKYPTPGALSSNARRTALLAPGPSRAGPEFPSRPKPATITDSVGDSPSHRSVPDRRSLMARPSPRWASSPVTIFWVVTALALVLRTIYILQMSSPELNPGFWQPGGDAGVHDRWARQLLTGTWPLPEPFFRAPLYPYFLGGLYGVFGVDGPAGVQLVHGLVSALGAGLAALCALRLWSVRAAWSAGLLMATLWSSIYFAGELLAVTLCVTLNLLLLRLVLGRLSRRRLLLIGLVLGLSAITRPTVLVITPVLLWYLWRRGGLARQGWAPGWLVLAAGLALAIGPVTTHNLIRGGEPVLIAASGGVNFYIGNNRHADGRVAFLPGAPPDWQGELSDALELAGTETGMTMTARSADRYFWGRGLRFWRDDPGAALRLLARKSWLLLAAGERSNNKNLAFWRSRSPLLRWPVWPGWALLLGLALLGVRRSDLGRDERRLLLGVTGVYAAALLLFFINARFRLPLLAWLTVPAGGGLSVLWTAFRSRSWRDVPTGPAVAAVLVVAISVIPDAVTYHQDPATDFESWRALGNRYLAIQDAGRAISTWERALAIDEQHPARANRWSLPRIYQPLGQLYLAQRRSDLAVTTHRRWVQRLPESTTGRMGLANLLLQTGRPREAGENLQFVLAHEPGNDDARLGYAWSLQRTGQPGAALVQFEQVARNVNNPSADFGVGLSLLALGRLPAAEAQFQSLLDRQPQFWQAYENLADLYAQTGQAAKEQQVWRALLKRRPEHERAQARLALLR